MFAEDTPVLIRSVAYWFGNLVINVQKANISRELQRELESLTIKTQKDVDASVGKKVLIYVRSVKNFRRVTIDSSDQDCISATDLDTNEYYSEVDRSDVYSFNYLKSKKHRDAEEARQCFVFGFHSPDVTIDPRRLVEVFESVKNIDWIIQNTEEKHPIESSLPIVKLRTLKGGKAFEDVARVPILSIPEKTNLPPLIIGSEEEVLVIRTGQELSCQLQSLPSHELQRLELELTTIATGQGSKYCRPETLERNEIVGVPYGGMIIRGCVVAVRRRVADVFLLDRGHVEKFYISRLRYLPEEFSLRIPRYGVQILLPEDPKVDYDDFVLRVRIHGDVNDLFVKGTIEGIVGEAVENTKKPLEESYGDGEVPEIVERPLDDPSENLEVPETAKTPFNGPYGDVEISEIAEKPFEEPSRDVRVTEVAERPLDNPSENLEVPETAKTPFNGPYGDDEISEIAQKPFEEPSTDVRVTEVAEKTFDESSEDAEVLKNTQSELNELTSPPKIFPIDEKLPKELADYIGLSSERFAFEVSQVSPDEIVTQISESEWEIKEETLEDHQNSGAYNVHETDLLERSFSTDHSAGKFENFEIPVQTMEDVGSRNECLGNNSEKSVEDESKLKIVKESSKVDSDGGPQSSESTLEDNGVCTNYKFDEESKGTLKTQRAVEREDADEVFENPVEIESNRNSGETFEEQESKIFESQPNTSETNHPGMSCEEETILAIPSEHSGNDKLNAESTSEEIDSENPERKREIVNILEQCDETSTDIHESLLPPKEENLSILENDEYSKVELVPDQLQEASNIQVSEEENQEIIRYISKVKETAELSELDSEEVICKNDSSHFETLRSENKSGELREVSVPDRNLLGNISQVEKPAEGCGISKHIEEEFSREEFNDVRRNEYQDTVESAFFSGQYEEAILIMKPSDCPDQRLNSRRLSVVFEEKGETENVCSENQVDAEPTEVATSKNHYSASGQTTKRISENEEMTQQENAPEKYPRKTEEKFTDNADESILQMKRIVSEEGCSKEKIANGEPISGEINAKQGNDSKSHIVRHDAKLLSGKNESHSNAQRSKKKSKSHVSVRNFCEYPSLSFRTRKGLPVKAVRVVRDCWVLASHDPMLKEIDEYIKKMNHVPEILEEVKIGQTVLVNQIGKLRRVCVLKKKVSGEKISYLVSFLDFVFSTTVTKLLACPTDLAAAPRAILFIKLIGSQSTASIRIGKIYDLLVDRFENYMIHGSMVERRS